MSSAIDLVIAPRPRDLGDFEVRRVLPYAKRRMVGPFVFFDHMGPVNFEPGQGMDVRPHPHINLATVTYLFEGEIMHRDSLGYEQPIRAGAVNWMTAGKGIAHSERTRDELRETGFKMHGIQSWVALPADAEEVDPSFHHHPADTLPVIERDGATLTLIAGRAYGAESPVEVFSPMFYVDAKLEAGATLDMPDEYEDRAVYVAEGTATLNGEPLDTATMAVLTPDAPATLTTEAPARVMLLGGAPLDGPRHIWWNFVSSRKERIEQAKADWKDGRFDTVPGETDFIPLPDD